MVPSCYLGAAGDFNAWQRNLSCIPNRGHGCTDDAAAKRRHRLEQCLSVATYFFLLETTEPQFANRFRPSERLFLRNLRDRAQGDTRKESWSEARIDEASPDSACCNGRAAGDGKAAHKTPNPILPPIRVGTAKLLSRSTVYKTTCVAMILTVKIFHWVDFLFLQPCD